MVSHATFIGEMDSRIVMVMFHLGNVYFQTVDLCCGACPDGDVLIKLLPQVNWVP